MVLGGVMVNMSAIGPKVRGFKSGRGQWIFKSDKIRNTISFGGEVKPSAPVVKFYDMLKNPSKDEQKCFIKAKFIFLSPVPPDLLLDDYW
jgi:hypothetical protein